MACRLHEVSQYHITLQQNGSLAIPVNLSVTAVGAPLEPFNDCCTRALMLESAWFPGDPEEGRSELGRPSKRRSGSTGRGKPAENRGKRKGSRFVVESKVFEVEAKERNGKSHVIISESKGELVSWVRLGPASVGLLIEGLIQCMRDGKEGRWEKGWKKKGGTIPGERGQQGGSFIRLGVTDMEKRRFGICIPKGKGEKGGWVSMVESYGG
ncbi:hypothetical protein CK203_112192 [Vitis vinifera]|uniref:Uncharacterized protein n=1 Tax=Vitis vinifera TaxID=29760 RepID=A0A438CSF6_VITVI|nr:hypothetical protein CK203_112192 [Vitis vinifera]